jgi:hypothetical protein
MLQRKEPMSTKTKRAENKNYNLVLSKKNPYAKS